MIQKQKTCTHYLPTQNLR